MQSNSCSRSVFLLPCVVRGSAWEQFQRISKTAASPQHRQLVLLLFSVSVSVSPGAGGHGRRTRLQIGIIRTAIGYTGCWELDCADRISLCIRLMDRNRNKKVKYLGFNFPSQSIQCHQVKATSPKYSIYLLLSEDDSGKQWRGLPALEITVSHSYVPHAA